MGLSTRIAHSILTASLLTWSIEAGAATLVGKVITASGKVTAAGRVLSRGSAVHSGETITTGGDSRAQLRYTDGTLIALYPNSSYRVDDYHYGEQGKADSQVATLVKGGLRTITGKTSKNNPENYKLETGVATIGVRGTNYAVNKPSPRELQTGIFGGGISVHVNADNRTFNFSDTSEMRFASFDASAGGGVQVKTSAEPPPGLMDSPRVTSQPGGGTSSSDGGSSSGGDSSSGSGSVGADGAGGGSSSAEGPTFNPIQIGSLSDYPTSTAINVTPNTPTPPATPIIFSPLGYLVGYLNPAPTIIIYRGTVTTAGPGISDPGFNIAGGDTFTQGPASYTQAPVGFNTEGTFPASGDINWGVWADSGLPGPLLNGAAYAAPVVWIAGVATDLRDVQLGGIYSINTSLGEGFFIGQSTVSPGPITVVGEFGVSAGAQTVINGFLQLSDPGADWGITFNNATLNNGGEIDFSSGTITATTNASNGGTGNPSLPATGFNFNAGFAINSTVNSVIGNVSISSGMSQITGVFFAPKK